MSLAWWQSCIIIYTQSQTLVHLSSCLTCHQTPCGTWPSLFYSVYNQTVLPSAHTCICQLWLGVNFDASVFFFTPTPLFSPPAFRSCRGWGRRSRQWYVHLTLLKTQPRFLFGSVCIISFFPLLMFRIVRMVAFTFFWGDLFLLAFPEKASC